MELQRAIEILTLYNRWRIGENVDMVQPSQITLALNKVIDEYTKSKVNVTISEPS